MKNVQQESMQWMDIKSILMDKTRARNSLYLEGYTVTNLLPTCRMVQEVPQSRKSVRRSSPGSPAAN
eukprot:4926981-Amphidinium_carterae.1